MDFAACAESERLPHSKQTTKRRKKASASSREGSKQRRALMIADNRLALNAGWHEEMLRIELAALQEVDFNLDLTMSSPRVAPFGFCSRAMMSAFRTSDLRNLLRRVRARIPYVRNQLIDSPVFDAKVHGIYHLERTTDPSSE